MDRLSLHLLLLGWASIAAAGWLTTRAPKRLLLAGLLAEGNLLATSLLLAGGHRFGAPAWFFAGSLLLAGATGLLAWHLAGGRKDPPPAWWQGALAVGLAPFAAAALLTAHLYAPGHPAATLPFNRDVARWFASRYGRPPPVPAPAPNPAAPALFAVDLVQADDPRIKVSAGLQPAEGPFPLRGLPVIRWARQPSFRVTLNLAATPARLRLFFSVRLQHRPTAFLTVLCNGRVVRQCPLTDATAWLDQAVEADLGPGENTLEFRDDTPDHEPDWLEYLERYPDVKQHVIAHNLPLEAGAREHYEGSGRAEGRTLRTRPVPGPENSFYFMFRSLRLEGFKSP